MGPRDQPSMDRSACKNASKAPCQKGAVIATSLYCAPQVALDSYEPYNSTRMYYDILEYTMIYENKKNTQASQPSRVV